MTARFACQAARDVGFDDCGIVALAPLPDEVKEEYRAWLLGGNNAEMRYLNSHIDIRNNPQLLMKSGARTAVVTLFSYKPERRQPKHLPQVATFAYGLDYHYIIKQKLHELLQILQREEPNIVGRALVDSAPLHERYWAVRAGLGWVGKSGMLVNAALGTTTFIGTLLLNINIEAGAEVQPNRCALCTRCVEACPSQALLGNGLLDARRCFSYRTIEAHRSSAPSEAEAGAHFRYIFGCDICQNVCPWNVHSRTCRHREMQLLPPLEALTAQAWQGLSNDEFEVMFAQSAIQRAGCEGMKKNLARYTAT